MKKRDIEFRWKPTSRLSAFIDYLFMRRTPSRILCDDSLTQLAPMLEGTVIELGGYKMLNYSTFAIHAKKYVVTNISGDCDEFVDILNMRYADNSVDSFISANVLEHISDPWKAIQEIHRCLKPSGRLLLVVPFMYYQHGAPNDFYRFSSSALSKMLEGFNILRFEHLGGRLSTISLLLQYKITLPLGCLFFIISCFFEKIPNDCPMLYAVLAERGAE
jgi:SAM-dependent methyltransferase